MSKIEVERKEALGMSGLVAILKVWGVGLVRRVDRANADRQRWMRGPPVYTKGREQDGERS